MVPTNVVFKNGRYKLFFWRENMGRVSFLVHNVCNNCCNLLLIKTTTQLFNQSFIPKIMYTPRAPASSHLTLSANSPIVALFQSIEKYSKESRGFFLHKVIFMDYNLQFKELTAAVPELQFEELTFGKGEDLLKYLHVDTVFKFPWAWEKLDIIVPAGYVAVKFKCCNEIMEEMTTIAFPASKHRGQLMSVFVLLSTYAPFKTMPVPGISLKLAFAEFMGVRDEHYVITSK